MNIIETLKSALQSLLANKIRSLLTMLGIIIGISSVIIISMVGKGSQNSITGDLTEAMDRSTVIQVQSDDEVLRKIDYINEENLSYIAKLDSVTAVSPSMATRTMLPTKDPKRSRFARLSATSADFASLENADILYGRSFTEEEVIAAKKVILIDDIYAMRIFERIDVAGEIIEISVGRGRRLKKQSYLIVGVFEHPMKNLMSTMGGREFFFPYIPYTTFQKYVEVEPINSIKITFDDLNKKDQISSEIVTYLENVHKKKEIYQISLQASGLDSFNRILSTLSLLLTAVAGISLLVGGIGVMNIMLVTVTERTKEIGIRKSLGARNKDILIQFLIEAAFLTIIGGFMGISLGYAVSMIVGHLINIKPVLSTVMLLVSLGVSGGIGIIFGTYPANKAAQLNPIDALRHE